MIDQFRRATIGEVRWEHALDALAAATGARIAQLAALDHHGNFDFNILTETPQELLADYMAHGGGDPAVNIRNRAAIDARPFACLTEENFATPEVIARAPIYRDVFIPHDIPHICIAPLNGRAAQLCAVGLLRSARQGPADRDTRRLVEAVTPVLSDCVNTMRRLGRGIEAAVLATAETLAGPTILLGGGLKIISLSPAAEALLRAGTHLSVRGGRLIAGAGSSAALADAFAAVVARGAASRRNVPLVLHGTDAAEPLLVELAPLPGHGAIMAEAQAMLVARAHRPAPRSAAILAAAFSLTPAEATIGMLLAEGLDLSEIAARRGCTVNTVRTQLKTLMGKTDTRRQAELVVKIRRY